MNFWIILFAGLFFTAAVMLFFVLRRVMYLSSVLETVVEELKKSFDVLKVVYQNVDHKSKLDITMNEPVVRDLVDDIRAAKYTVFVTLNSVKSFLEYLEVEIEDEELNNTIKSQNNE